ncbi:hypothetical protein HZ992_15275 [Rhizobacter sp. AJA081-3]|uniref:hypothetical protein n=1 Tax=Rhizobacter sp. AJA081-3 TaxID=2753607 RepID=UPI001ADEC553|nr:hypothetical protein [Rhizobacter sp. AJA081-3]QTN21542.1 hypothetical protein HZ992_15275 [Rhizobacter sp. AJA081-3]
MVSISITEEAQCVIRERYELLCGDDETIVPFLVLQWMSRAMESSRGPDGRVVWEEVAPAQWAAEIAGWEQERGQKLKEHALRIGGLSVLLDMHAESAKGSFLVDAVNGKLVVKATAP